MRKVVFIILIFSISCLIFSQNLGEKKKKLEDLQDQISREQEHIQQVEQQKKKSESDLSSTKKKKLQSEQKIKKLKKSEKKVKKELDTTIGNLKSTSSYLENLHALCQDEFNKLLFAHYRGVLFSEKKTDTYLLASLIRQTADEIEEIECKKSGLEKIKKKENRKYEDLVWTRIVTNKKKKKYTTQIGSLEGEISNYEKERLAALEQKKKLEEEAAALDELITKLQADIFTEHYTYKFSTDKLIWPVKGEIIRGYGVQKSDQYKVSTKNNGIDISAITGTNIVAVEDGVIAFAEWYNGAGKLVIIDHQNGFHTLYSHNNSLLVSKGDKVKKNQLIALSGSTGSARQPCVHFELRKKGIPVNPMNYLE